MNSNLFRSTSYEESYRNAFTELKLPLNPVLLFLVPVNTLINFFMSLFYYTFLINTTLFMKTLL